MAKIGFIGLGNMGLPMARNLVGVSIPDQKGPMHRRDSGQWFGSGARLGVSARHIADARQGALAAGQSGAASIVV